MLYGIKSPDRKASWEVTGLIQRRHDGGLDQGSSSGCEEKPMGVGCALKVALT